jgi:hypothetical protein
MTPDVPMLAGMPDAQLGAFAGLLLHRQLRHEAEAVAGYAGAVAAQGEPRPDPRSFIAPTAPAAPAPLGPEGF